jgi:organic radical activating enzyme
MRKPIKIYGKEFYEKPNRISVLAYIIDRCGYNCDYCYNTKPRTGKILDLKILNIFINHLINYHKKEVHLDIIGGEVTDHPDIFNFIDNYSKNINLTLYSNFSKDISIYKRLINAGCQLILTYHPHTDPNVFIEKFAKFDENEYDKIVSLPIMYRPGISEKSIYMFDLMKQRFPKFNALDFSLLDTNINFPKVQYTEKELEEFAKRVSQSGISNTVIEYDDNSQCIVNDNYFFANRKKLDFKFWKCNAGLDYLYIHFDGTVHPCDENDGIILYDINKGGNFVFPSRPMICPRHTCPCLFDVYKEKVFK